MRNGIINKKGLITISIVILLIASLYIFKYSQFKLKKEAIITFDISKLKNHLCQEFVIKFDLSEEMVQGLVQNYLVNSEQEFLNEFRLHDINTLFKDSILIIYINGFDKRDNNAESVYEVNDLSYFKSLTKKGDIILLEFNLRGLFNAFNEIVFRDNEGSISDMDFNRKLNKDLKTIKLQQMRYVLDCQAEQYVTNITGEEARKVIIQVNLALQECDIIYTELNYLKTESIVCDLILEYLKLHRNDIRGDIKYVIFPFYVFEEDQLICTSKPPKLPKL